MADQTIERLREAHAAMRALGLTGGIMVDDLGIKIHIDTRDAKGERLQCVRIASWDDLQYARDNILIYHLKWIDSELSKVQSHG